MEQGINKDQLFIASCVALVVTSMTFAIRAGILTDLAGDFNLTDQQLGHVNSMAFYGFPVAMLVGGAIYNNVGPKVLLTIAFISHLLGLILTMTAGGFWGLMISTFFIGFANGSVEAACNPLIADMYPTKQTEMLNKFHVWFPGGIVIGSLITYFLAPLGVSWQILIGTMLVPTAIYGFLILGKTFPRSENIVSDTKTNIGGILTPLFFFVAICMTMTATTEFGATQWVDRIMGNAGANPMILLALTAGLMATGRFFAGPLIHRLNPVGVLVGSAIVAAIGLFMLSQFTGGMVYVATAVFAIGICYFWPTMIGFTAEYIPKSGAFGLSLIGGAGMLGAGIWNPIIGGWIDNYRSEALAQNQVVERNVEDYLTANPTIVEKMEDPSTLVARYGAYLGALGGELKTIEAEKEDGTLSATAAAERTAAIDEQRVAINEVEASCRSGYSKQTDDFPDNSNCSVHRIVPVHAGQGTSRRRDNSEPESDARARFSTVDIASVLDSVYHGILGDAAWNWSLFQFGRNVVPRPFFQQFIVIFRLEYTRLFQKMSHRFPAASAVEWPGVHPVFFADLTGVFLVVSGVGSQYRQVQIE